VKTLIVDNHDSFSFNLAQLIGEVNGEAPLVVRNDEMALDELRALPFDNVVISPGPGHPGVARDFGVSAGVIASLTDTPLLGVCLGMQGMALAHGAAVAHAPEPVHGRASLVTHDGQGLFEGLPNPLSVIRYHSLCVQGTLPEPLVATAHTADGILMALAHRDRPLWGVQFHPESVCTEGGLALLRNFRDMTHRQLRQRAPRIVVPAPTPPVAAAPTHRLLWRRWRSAAQAEVVFGRLFGHSPTSFWLDSARVIDGLSRFSFMGEGQARIAYRVDSCEWLSEEDGVETRLATPGLFTHLRERLAAEHVAPDPALPFDFAGGYVGSLGYELKAETGGAVAHEADVPDANLLRVERFVAFDHVTGELYAVAVATPSDEAAAETWLQDTQSRIQALEAVAPPADAALLRQPRGAAPQIQLEVDRPAYLHAIAQCQAKIRDGESYEVCLTNRLRAGAEVDALRLYQLLRRRNPAPYAAYLRFGEGLSVLSSSPERFLQLDRSGRLEARPIKGTAARHADATQDAAAADTLRTSEKTRAENLMIVDLLRNDLGRVCEIGTVRVPRLMAIESYATVHQMVSTIEGRLRAELTAVDALVAAFPGGSMTGAPKERTMEIIDALEPSARGIYSGAIGYLSFNGTMDFSVVIRTLVVQGDRLSIGTGGAIVALSKPDDEFDEIVLKGEVLVRAVAEHLGSG
jgi:para-aminobenzoate synthetase